MGWRSTMAGSTWTRSPIGACALLALSVGCGLVLQPPQEVEVDARAIDAGRRDAPGLDAPGLDATRPPDVPPVEADTGPDVALDATPDGNVEPADASSTCLEPCDPEESCVDGSCRIRWVGLTAGHAHTCAWTTRGKAYCWGSNEDGQCGVVGASPIPRRVDIDVDWIEAGYHHTCADAREGGLHCWGLDEDAQVGDGDRAGGPVPYRVGPSAGFASAGGRHTLAGAERLVFAWGANDSGQLSSGDLMSRALPYDIDLDVGVRTFAAGRNHTCFVTAEGSEVYCVGAAGANQLGDGIERDRSRFWRQVTRAEDGTPLSGIELIASAADHTCASSGRGALCWGDNSEGQLGDAALTAARAVPIPRVAGVRSLDTGGAHACVVDDEGAVLCWGSNSHGQRGGAATTAAASEVPELPGPAAQVVCGNRHTCVLLRDGTIACAGDNRTGQLGSATGLATRARFERISEP